MKILICICTYKRNNFLNKCLLSFYRAVIPFNYEIEFLIIDNTINGNAKYIINKVKKNLDIKFTTLMKKREELFMLEIGV